jgi:regulator of replication initiation timing
LYRIKQPGSTLKQSKIDFGHNFHKLEHPQGELYEPTTDTQVRNILKILLRVQKAMFGNITASGNGDNDPWNFASECVKKGNGVTIMTTISAYYFYMQCKCFPEIITAFSANLKDDMLGEDISDVIKPKKKHRRASPTSEDDNSSIAASLALIASTFKVEKFRQELDDLEKEIILKNEEITNKMKQMQMMYQVGTQFARDQIKQLEEEIPQLQTEVKQLKNNLEMAKREPVGVGINDTFLPKELETPSSSKIQERQFRDECDDTDSELEDLARTLNK